MLRSRLAKLAALAVLVAPASTLAPHRASAQDGGRDPRTQIAAYERYLARKPYNDQAFDKLVEAAVGVNGLAELVARFAEQHAATPESVATRIVLARLYARVERGDEALALLAEVEGEGAELFRLVGTLHLREGEWEAAVDALERAAAEADDPTLLESIHKERGQALLAAGELERAEAAFRALAEIDPESFHLRLEAASELAWHGLVDAALEVFAEADRLAGDDTAKRCRVLAEIGQLHERRGDGAEAIASYRAAIDLMARGNWLKRDLHDRVLSIHQRAGTLDELVERARADAAAGNDLDAREFLARALAAAERPEEARDALAAAVADFPGDLALSRHYLEQLERLGDDDGRIAEYQRILAERPEELELYLELGAVFASSGRFEQARLQWSRTLERRLADPGLCVRIAGLYALYDQADDAIAMYERAIELEPRDLRHYSDLARLLTIHERIERRDALLERADGTARGDAGLLTELAGLWNEYDRADRARAALEEAVALAPGDASLLNQLADALVRDGEVERATEILHRVVEEARETGLRKSAVDRLVRVFRAENRLAELVDLELARAAAEPTAVAPRLVLGKCYETGRLVDEAIGAYEELVAIDPAEELPRRALARLYEERGQVNEALAQYEALIELKPQARRTFLKELARLHLERHDQEAAFACYEEILRGAPDNSAAFVEVAEAYDRIGRHERVLECLQQAVRLEPESAPLRLKLAQAHRLQGDWPRAREHVTEAARLGTDEETRAEAREQLYVLLSETGQLEGEIASLRARVDDNPYDLEAPLLLTDVYVRELEYELALDMLDRLLRYQPREGRLLAERARILRLLERNDEAVRDYETLWKLPGADQGALAIDIAEAALEAGDLERAERVLANVGDARRAARLYREHDHPDRAIAVLERAMAAAPGDARLFLDLARVHEDVGDRAAAAETLERVLALEGDSWRVLTRLGEMLYDLDREEEALEIGERLFSVTRLPEPLPEDEDEKQRRQNQQNPWNRSTYRWFNASQQYDQRISELKTYFESKGHLDRFIELGLEDLRRAPTNDTLYTRVLQSLQQKGDRHAEARSLAREVRAAALETGRAPTGQLLDTWVRRLEMDEARLYGGNQPFALKRLAELEARVDEGTASASEHLERVELLGVLERDADREGAFAAGLAAFPEDVQLLAGRAQTLVQASRFEEAVPYFERLVAALAASDADERRAEQFEFDYRAQRRNLRQGLPIAVQRRADDALLRRMFAIANAPSTYLSWGHGREVWLDGARMALARCLLKLDRTDDAKATLAALEPRNPEQVARWVELVQTYYDEELYDEAWAICEHLRALDDRLGAEPVLGHARSWDYLVRNAMQSGARILEKRGEVLASYELMRRFGLVQEGELLLTTQQAFPAAEARFRALHDSARAALGEGGGEEALELLRERTILLADVLQFQKRWDEVQALYEDLWRRLPDDFSIAEQVAALHLRAGRIDDVVATRLAVIERKRELNRDPQPDLDPPGRRLDPTPPAGGGGMSVGSSRIYYAGRFYGSSGGSGLQSVRGDYMAIVRLHLDRQEPAQAAEMLARIAREDAASFRWMGWEVRNLVDGAGMGATALPVLRLLASYNPGDDNIGLTYARALIADKQFDEAHKVLTRITSKGRRGWYYVEQARAELETLEERMGWDERVPLEELVADVEAQPKNVKVRVKLAERLKKARDFEAALAHARAAEDLAPHQDEVADLVLELLQVLDRRDEVEAKLRERIAKSKDDTARFSAAAQVATWMHDRGEDPEAIDALFESVVEFRWGGSIQYAPSSWWLQQGEVERAEDALRKEIAAVGEDSPYAGSARNRLAALARLAGDPRPGLDQLWKRFEKATNRGQRATIFTQLAGLLAALPEPRAIAGELDGLVADDAPDRELRRALLRGAWHLAVGETDAAEELLEDLVADREDALFLVPALVDLARQRGDLETALARLERLRETGRVSPGRRAATSLGALTEEQALRAEIASLHFDLGREDEAVAMWEDLFVPEEREEARQALINIYGAVGLDGRVVELYREQLAEEDGDKNVWLLGSVSQVELESGNLTEARRLRERAVVLSAYDPSRRLELADVHRRAGTLEAHFEELLAASEADPDDASLARVVLELAEELGRSDVTQRMVAALSDRPDLVQSLRPYLIRQHLLRGEDDAALDVLGDYVRGNVGSAYQRWRYGERLARRLAERGDLAGARELLLKVHDGDDESAEFLDDHYTLLANAARWDEALAVARRSVELAPRDIDPRVRVVATLAELGEDREALEEAFAALELPDPREYARTRLLERLPALAETAGGLAELRAAAAARADDPAAHFRLGAVLAARHELEDARAALARARELAPTHHGARSILWSVELRLGRVEDARRILRGLLETLDAERELDDDAARAIVTLRSELATLDLRREGLEAARRTLDGLTGRRYARPNAYAYSYDNDPLSDRDGGSWLLEHGFDAEFVAYRELRDELDRWNRGNWTEEVWRARYRAEGAPALEELWEAVVEPGRGLVGDPSAELGYSYSYDDGGETWDSRWTPLVETFRAEGRLEELLERVRAELATWPRDPVMTALERHVLVELERWDEVAERHRARVADEPEELAPRLDLAEVLGRWLGEIDEALALAEGVLDEYVRRVPQGNYRTEWASSSSGGRKRATPGPVRFQWSGGGARGFVNQYWSSSRFAGIEPDAEESRARRLVMALRARNGDLDGARELERVERALQLPSWSGSQRVPWELAQRYLDLDVPEEADRLARLALEEGPESSRAPICRRMVAAWADAGDDARGDAWRADLERILTEDVNAAPWNAGALRARAESRLTVIEDVPGAREDVDRLLSWRLGHSAAVLDLRVRLAEERFDEVLAGLAALEERAAEEFRVLGDAFRAYTEGLARAGLGDREGATPLLRRALGLDPDHHLADEAREALGE